jgi:hypothetical protein
MGVDYVCLPKAKLVISVWEGNVKLDHWTRNLSRLFADPDLPKTNMQLVDLRFASVDPAIGEDAIKQVIEDQFVPHQEIVAGRKIAAVAGDAFDRVRVFERIAESMEVSVIAFNDLGRACTWLGIDQADAEREIEQVRDKINNGK